MKILFLIYFCGYRYRVQHFNLIHIITIQCNKLILKVSRVLKLTKLINKILFLLDLCHVHWIILLYKIQTLLRHSKYIGFFIYYLFLINIMTRCLPQKKIIETKKNKILL